TEARNADGREIGDGIPTQSSALVTTAGRINAVRDEIKDISEKR
ncbi:hypothetical protein Tco_1331071, partial [Tanacetum coccineum]